MEPNDLAYIAGYFDGEGTVRVNGYTLNVSVYNSFLPMLKFLEASFGGSIYRDRRKVKNGVVSRKAFYCWTITSRDALHFLKSILPYLYEKSPQVELAIRCFEEFGRAGGKDTVRKRLQDMKRVSWEEPDGTEG